MNRPSSARVTRLLGAAGVAVQRVALVAIGAGYGIVSVGAPSWQVVVVGLVAVAMASFDSWSVLDDRRRAFRHGCHAGAATVAKITSCRHEWQRHRDERTEDLYWSCTECGALRR